MLSGMTMEVKAEQPANEPLGISVSVDGNVTDTRDVQSIKAFAFNVTIVILDKSIVGSNDVMVLSLQTNSNTRLSLVKIYENFSSSIYLDQEATLLYSKYETLLNLSLPLTSISILSHCCWLPW